MPSMKRFLLPVLFFFTQVSFGQHLLKDITDEASLPYNSSVLNLYGAKFNGRFYFVAQSLENGFEVFYTDGTEAGTSMLKEIVPGEKGIGTQVSFGATSDFLLFGFEGEDGNQLWSSDGTSAGTHKIASVKPYLPGSTMVELNGVLYFGAVDEEHGSELWRSDGTVAGTFIVKDIFPEQNGSFPGELTVNDNKLFFIAIDNVHRAELWVSDGTASGTMLVKDSHPGTGSDFYTYMTAAGNTVYFIDESQVWKTDGTEIGTVAVTNFPADESIMKEKMTVINDKLMFRHYSSVEGLEMYVLDLATGESGLLKETFAGTSPSWSNSIYATPVLLNGKAWFFAEHDHNKFSLWKTDGTPENTELAFDLENQPGQQWPQSLFVTSEKLFFTLSDNYFKATDGVSTPILLTRRGIGQAVDMNGKLIFSAGNPWITDGTAEGTRLIRQINKERAFYSRTIAKTSNGFLFSDYNYPVTVTDMWYSNGTAAGTNKVHSFPSAFHGDISVNENKALFGAIDGNDGYSIWVSDGTSLGTKQMKAGTWYDYTGVDRIKWIGNTAIIFSGYYLWKTDGTSTGTVVIRTLPFQYSGHLHSPVLLKNSLYFFLADQLWKTDGTEAGTVLVKVLPISTTPFFRYLIAGENRLYFVAEDHDHGWEVWTSDGTADGTHLVKDVNMNGPIDYYIPVIKTVVNDVAYFVDAQTTGNSELWRTDGTEAGTYVVKEINEDLNKGSNPNILETIGNTIYFTANDGVHGYEFWKTDGTAKGTVMIKDIYPGKFSSIWSNQCATYVVNGVLYFSAVDEAHGYELWKTDGTEAGTQLVYDVNPGILSGVSTVTGSMTSVGNRLIFTANDGVHGYEFWEYLAGPEIIAEVEDESGEIKIFPNPASHTIVVNAGSFKLITVKDLVGRDVITTDATGDNTTLNVGHLPRGMYVIRLEGGNQKVVSRKIILN
jgi:ELWxxDGT repeat protein